MVVIHGINGKFIRKYACHCMLSLTNALFYMHRMFTLTDGTIVLYQQRYASVTTYLLIDIAKSGLSGLIITNANITDSTSLLFYSNQYYIWSSISSNWLVDGNINIISEVMMRHVTNWNFTGFFEYGNNSYKIILKEGNYSNPMDMMLYIEGTGNYGGNWHHW